MLSFQNQFPRNENERCEDYSFRFWNEIVLLDEATISEHFDLLNIPFLDTFQKSSSCNPMDYTRQNDYMEQIQAFSEYSKNQNWDYKQEFLACGLSLDVKNGHKMDEESPVNLPNPSKDLSLKMEPKLDEMKSLCEQFFNKRKTMAMMNNEPLDPNVSLAILLAAAIVHHMLHDWGPPAKHIVSERDTLHFKSSISDAYLHVLLDTNNGMKTPPGAVSKRLLVSAYKIHITPRLPHYFKVLGAILKARQSDKILEVGIPYIKVCLYSPYLYGTYNSGAAMPPIVLYVQQNDDKRDFGFTEADFGADLKEYWGS
eukprot:Nk52_evm3s2284 gene=Nk52_evmTU3s2284